MSNPINIQRALDYGISRAQDQAALAKIKAAAPIKPAKPQEPLDFGLFSDDSLQSDLIDSLRR